MRRIRTNVREYRPHIKWILKKLRLRTYDVFIMFCSPTQARRVCFPVTKGQPEMGMMLGVIKGTASIWINSALLRRYCGGLTPISVLAHELRHYYQRKLNKFPQTAEDWEYYQRTKNMVLTEAMKQRYLNDPREQDAREFAAWAEKQFEAENSTGKCKLRHYPKKITIVV